MNNYSYIKPGMSFVYNGEEFCTLDVKITESDNEIKYVMPDGLEITTKIQYYADCGVVRWTNYWNNPTDHASGLVEHVRDCDITLDFERDDPNFKRHKITDWERKSLTVIETVGANVNCNDYMQIGHPIWNGEEQTYANCFGRSCLGVCPYFDVNQGDKGALIALGWTGSWYSKFNRKDDSLRVRGGIDDSTFRILPGESFRTCSVAAMLYDKGEDDAHNRFRAFMRDISPLQKGGARGEQAPFSAIFWGGIPSDELIRRWQGIIDQKLPFDTCWVDAGWYEPLKETTRKGQMDNWPNLGDWTVSKFYHPQGYRDVVDFLHKNDRKFMLWFEPERMRRNAIWTKYLEEPQERRGHDVLVALNDDSACDDVIEKISSRIEEIGIDVYRQDYNIVPYFYWENSDEPERKGIVQIKYINNLYRFWDALLERFPNLLIDNCAGGGHRNDFEMLSRAVPLWRSDYQCTWDCSPEADQIQNEGSAWWMPYSSIGFGPKFDDKYAVRSAYNNGLVVRTWEHIDEQFYFGQAGEDFDFIRKMLNEYVAVRRYFALDYYRITEPSLSNTVWQVSQYQDSEDGSGIIIGFRRPECPYESVTVKMRNLTADATYIVTDLDSNTEAEFTGEYLMTNGYKINTSDVRESRLISYRKK